MGLSSGFQLFVSKRSLDIHKWNPLKKHISMYSSRSTKICTPWKTGLHPGYTIAAGSIHHPRRFVQDTPHIYQDCDKVNPGSWKSVFNNVQKHGYALWSCFKQKQPYSKNWLGGTYMLAGAAVFETSRSYSTKRDISLPIIYLFTKEGCTLCDEAKAALEPHRHRFTLIEVDITLPENVDWYKKYKNDIPVFHMYEDFLFMHRVNLDILEKALKQHGESENKK